jgi:nucleolin
MATLFVGNLPFTATDEDINFLFSSFGCTEAKMQFHDDTGRSKGWALVSVSSDSANVIAQMHDTEFQGRNLVVREDRKFRTGNPSNDFSEKQQGGGGGYGGGGFDQQPEPCNTVYVGNLPWDVEDAQLIKYFHTPPPVSVKVQTRADGRSNGYALVSYNSVEEAQQAINDWNGFEIGDRAMRCRFDSAGGKGKGSGSRPARGKGRGDSKPRGGGGGGGGGYGGGFDDAPAPCNTVYVGNLPWDVDTAQLGGYFAGASCKSACATPLACARSLLSLRHCIVQLRRCRHATVARVATRW